LLLSVVPGPPSTSALHASAFAKAPADKTADKKVGHYEERAQGRGTQKPAPAPAPPPRTFFTSTLPEAELRNKQAVLDTTLGTIVIDLLPEAAPNHVAHFMTRAREGAYDGTTFHRVVTMGIIQGGDPLSKDPAQAAKYGTGGLGELRFEPNREKHTRGAVSAVLVPGNRDSGGSQFFISVTDQPALDGQYRRRETFRRSAS
jgi:peptidyl-prolyl cis-trans isomerase B (cyclophilin B)